MDTYKPGDLSNFFKTAKLEEVVAHDKDSSEDEVEETEVTTETMEDVFESSANNFGAAAAGLSYQEAKHIDDEADKAKRKKKEKKVAEPVLTEEEKARAERKKAKKEKRKRKRMSEKEGEQAKDGTETTEGAPETEDKDTKADDNENEEAGEASKASVTDRTVFVGNLPLCMNSKKIKALFTKFGKVESVRIRSVATTGVKVLDKGNQSLVKKVSVNQKQFADTRDNFNAYVVFADMASVDKAVAATGMFVAGGAEGTDKLNGKHLKVDRIGKASGREGVFDHKRSVFLGNLPFDTTEEAVRRYFGAKLGGAAQIEGIRLIRDATTGAGKGFGYLLLKDRSLVATALQQHEEVFSKRKLRVQVCGKRFKTSEAGDHPAKKARTSEGSGAAAAGKTTGGAGAGETEVKKKADHLGTKATVASGAQRRILGVKKARTHGATASIGSRKKNKKVSETKVKRNQGKPMERKARKQ